MASKEPGIAAALVDGALHAAEPGDGCRLAVDTLRRIVRADRAVLARALERWSRPVVHHRSPAADPPDVPIDLDTLGAAFDADGPVEIPQDDTSVLALALHPRDDVPWCLALAHAGATAWTADDHTALRTAAPYVTLVLEHDIYRRQLATRDDPGGSAAATRGRFLSVLAHELRNPLAPILMWTSTLRRLRREDPEVQRATQAVEHAVGLARRLLEEVGDMSRLERGLLELQQGPCDLREPVRAALEPVRPACTEKQITLVEDLPADPVPVRGDSVRLQQVVAHLLANALKFGAPGGTVSVQMARGPDHAALRVSDSGPGLPDAVLPQLFTPFVQGANACGGLGVGLAIAHRLLALHGGTIEGIAHGDHGGATFVVTLPLRDS